MIKEYLLIKQSQELHGSVMLSGAKNASLVIIASLILAPGKSVLHNVPFSRDVIEMTRLLEHLGALVLFDADKRILTVDASSINRCDVPQEIMAKMRASILVMGPLLARFGKAQVALPGGDQIGARPIDYHLKGFAAYGFSTHEERPFITAQKKIGVSKTSVRICLEYPSVGATENIMMYAASQAMDTFIVNAAIEPEVLDLIEVLNKMGANITCQPGAIIKISGCSDLRPVSHAILNDRMEAGSLILAVAMTGGSVEIPNARADYLDLFLEKISEIGHSVEVGTHPTPECAMQGIRFQATRNIRPVSIKTGPYPSFPTDLQSPMMAHLCLAQGISVIEETVFENRFIHAKELQKMGAHITISGNRATIHGVEQLYGASVIASDIRASCALMLAGLVAHDQTVMTGIEHWRRGYDQLDKKLQSLGAAIYMMSS